VRWQSEQQVRPQAQPHISCQDSPPKLSKQNPRAHLKKSDAQSQMPPENLEAGTEYQTPGILSKGFSAVASKIAADPDKTTTIYRRFDKLSARNLLFYQAELAELEGQQEVLDSEDRNATDEYSDNCQRDWRWFEKGAKVEGREQKKMELAMRIRHTLEKYRELRTNQEVRILA